MLRTERPLETRKKAPHPGAVAPGGARLFHRRWQEPRARGALAREAEASPVRAWWIRCLGQKRAGPAGSAIMTPCPFRSLPPWPNWKNFAPSSANSLPNGAGISTTTRRTWPWPWPWRQRRCWSIFSGFPKLRASACRRRSGGKWPM